MAGASVVSLASTGGDGTQNTLGGDALCLFAGFMYGVYCVALRRLLPDDDEVSMPLFFGLLGSFNFIIFGGFVALFHFTGVEPLSALTGRAFGLIVVKGLVDNVISDYLWARAVLLTSPTVSTVGLSLTVPLAMLSDLIIHGVRPLHPPGGCVPHTRSHAHTLTRTPLLLVCPLSPLLPLQSVPSPLSAVGAVLVVGGFIGVNTGDAAPPVTLCGVRICGDEGGGGGDGSDGAAPSSQAHSLNA